VLQLAAALVPGSTAAPLLENLEDGRASNAGFTRIERQLSGR
jgi:hypothetical protein